MQICFAAFSDAAHNYHWTEVIRIWLEEYLRGLRRKIRTGRLPVQIPLLAQLDLETQLCYKAFVDLQFE